MSAPKYQDLVIVFAIIRKVLMYALVTRVSQWKSLITHVQVNRSISSFFICVVPKPCESVCNNKEGSYIRSCNEGCILDESNNTGKQKHTVTVYPCHYQHTLLLNEYLNKIY